MPPITTEYVKQFSTASPHAAATSMAGSHEEAKVAMPISRPSSDTNEKACLLATPSSSNADDVAVQCALLRSIDKRLEEQNTIAILEMEC